jgi:hypothetical protein
MAQGLRTKIRKRGDRLSVLIQGTLLIANLPEFFEQLHEQCEEEAGKKEPTPPEEMRRSESGTPRSPVVRAEARVERVKTVQPLRASEDAALARSKERERLQAELDALDALEVARESEQPGADA